MGQNFVKLEMNSLNKGAVPDLFAAGLLKVLSNIGDPSTGADVTRKITISVEIKPDKMRETGKVKTSMSLSLAPILAAEGSVVFDSDGDGNVEAFTSLVKEQELGLEVGTEKKEGVRS